MRLYCVLPLNLDPRRSWARWRAFGERRFLQYFLIMSKIQIEIEGSAYKISPTWTVADLTAFWKKEKKMDPEVSILSWKQQVVQGIVKKIDIPTEGSLASHGVKDGSKYGLGTALLFSLPVAVRNLQTMLLF